MAEEVKYSQNPASVESPMQRNMDSVSPGASYTANRLTSTSEFFRNWVELRLMGNQPERRSYHTSFIFDKRLFVYGGLDIREGSLDSLFELSLQCLQELQTDELNSPGGEPLQSNFRWRQVQTVGGNNIPGRIAYHSSCVYKENMYLFGGNIPVQGYNPDGGEEVLADKLCFLNLRTMTWQVIRTRGDAVVARDEHTSCVDTDSTQMIVFGGFEQGTRSNQTSVYNFTTNTWENIEIMAGQPIPCPRSGHSAAIHNGNMYVFGGKNEDAEKLNDLWVYNIADKRWAEIEAEGEIPFERSGHSADIYDDYMVVFGGIWDVTKELNDLHLYSFSRNEWITIQASANSPQIGRSPVKLGASAGLGNQFSNMSGGGARDSPTAVSPMRAGGDLDSPSKFNRSFTKRQNSMTKTMKSAKKTKSSGGGGVRPMNTLALLQKTQSLKYEGVIRLNSPTSDHMKQSFLIKNHDASNFDQYYQQMRKRKTQGRFMDSAAGGSPMLRRNPNEMQIFHVKGKRPAARDGHTGIIFGDYLIIFGGDRHHMPFNDMFALDLEAEIDR